MALGAGSIAFVGFNADGNDNLAFVALDVIPSGTTIFFQDNEWTGAAFNTGESGWSWTATADVAAGTIVRLDNIGTGTLTPSVGPAVFVDSSNRGLAAATENVYAFLGTSVTAPTTFLAALASNTFALGGSGSTLTGTGLTVGTTAIEFATVDSDTDIAAYTGTRSGQATFSGYLSSINNPANWVTQDAPNDQSADGTAPDVPFSSTAFTALCFLAGTRIATPIGDVAVEELLAGDTVVTASGGRQTITWIGTGRVLAPFGARGASTPVIVRRGALADNVPYRDLRVTKGHSLFIDDVLIPVEFLINHRSILWDDRAQEVALYHIELASHDVLIADGAPAESYRDDGNRWLFQNANEAWDLGDKPACAPILMGGSVVDTIWRRLLDRAGPRPGMPITDQADFHLLADGVRIDAEHNAAGMYVFRLSRAAKDLRLVSLAAVPTELGVARDARCLGVAVRRIVLRRGTKFQTIEASDSRLEQGFHAYEADNDMRWTNGDAVLPAGLVPRFRGPFEVAVHVAATSRYVLPGELIQAA